MKHELINIKDNNLSNEVSYTINSYFNEDNSEDFMKTRKVEYSTYSRKEEYQDYFKIEQVNKFTSQDINLYLKGKNNYIDSLSRNKKLKRIY